MAYNAAAAADLVGHIRDMPDAVTTTAHVNPAELETTQQYAALDWNNEAVAVLFAAEHRPKLH